MQRLRRLLLGLFAVYIIVLVAGGWALRGVIESRVRDRLSRALDVDEVTIGSCSFSLWRGHLSLGDVKARRSEGAPIELRLGDVEVDIAGWGAVLFDRGVRRVTVHDLDLEVSARALAELVRRERPERRPIEIGELVVEQATLAVAPSALLPGVGRVEARITRATASDVTVGSAVSWLGGLAELDGEVAGPAGLSLAVQYKPGTLSLRGRMVAETGLTVPFTMPDLDPAADEIEHLRALAVAGMRAAGGLIASEAAKDGVRRLLERLLE
jgi:hypothetical protein